MFRVTEEPSSGSLVQCLAKNYKNDSIVSVNMDRSVLWQHIPSYTVNYTHEKRSEYAAITPTCPCQRTR